MFRRNNENRDRESAQSGRGSFRPWHLIVWMGAALGLFFASAAIGSGDSADAQSNDGILFGAYAQPRGSQNQIQAYQQLESQLGTQLPLLRSFAQWNTNLNNRTNRWVLDGDRTLMVSVKPERSNGQEVTWRSIANARPGSTIHNEMVALAQGAAALDGDVWFTFHHEPEANTRLGYGTSDDYIAAWRAIHRIFDEQGADVTWVWTMTSWSFEVDSSDRRSAGKWYPGDAFVDYLGADPYNWNQCRNPREGWQELERVIAPFVEFAERHPGKPLVLPEFASADGSERGFTKADWLSRARDYLKESGNAERFAGVIYFHDTQHETPNCRWWLDTTTSSLNVARQIAQDPYFRRDTSPAHTTGGQTPSQVATSSPAAPADPICTVRSTNNGDRIEWTDKGPGWGFNIRRNDRWVGETVDNIYTNTNVRNGNYVVIARGFGNRVDIACERV